MSFCAAQGTDLCRLAEGTEVDAAAGRIRINKPLHHSLQLDNRPDRQLPAGGLHVDADHVSSHRSRRSQSAPHADALEFTAAVADRTDRWLSKLLLRPALHMMHSLSGSR